MKRYICGMEKIGVMFVCLGNICRSPLAEAIFKEKLAQNNLTTLFEIESSGTANYHVGEEPDRRTIAIARKYNVPLEHLAQQLKKHHFEYFKYIIVMDESNKSNALDIASENADYEIFMMRDFDSIETGSAVIDPWFGEMEGFDECYKTLERSCNGLLHFLVEKHKLTIS